MDDMNDVIERVMGDALLFVMKDKLSIMMGRHPQFSWQKINTKTLAAPELDDVIIDFGRNNLIVIEHQSENWSITRSRKVDAPPISDQISIRMRDGKVADIENIMSYQYQGLIDDILAWCMATKLKIL